MTTLASPSDMAETFHEQPIEVELDDADTAPIPLVRYEQETRVNALLGVLDGLGLSEKRLAWLRGEIVKAFLPRAGERTKVKFARMEMGDWARWARAELDRRKRAGLAKINAEARLQGADRAMAIRANEHQVVTLQNRVDYHTLEADGITEMLDWSLRKAGMDDDAERAKTLARIDPMRQSQIAWSVASMTITTGGDIDPIPDEPKTFGGGENPT